MTTFIVNIHKVNHVCGRRNSYSKPICHPLKKKKTCSSISNHYHYHDVWISFKKTKCFVHSKPICFNGNCAAKIKTNICSKSYSPNLHNSLTFCFLFSHHFELASNRTCANTVKSFVIELFELLAIFLSQNTWSIVLCFTILKIDMLHF